MNADLDNRAGAVVMLSGGLDSTVSLALALESLTVRKALFFDYRQIPLQRERDASMAIAARYGLGFEEVALHWLGDLSDSGLVRGDIPDRSPGSSDAVRVENRNGIFVNAAAAFAAAAGCGVIIAGFNREEAETFPDNSKVWLEASNTALAIGAGHPVTVESPTIDMDKRRIASEGVRLGIPWELLWSCYRGGDLMCGRCESCSRLKEAVAGTEAERYIRFEG